MLWPLQNDLIDHIMCLNLSEGVSSRFSAQVQRLPANDVKLPVQTSLVSINVHRIKTFFYIAGVLTVASVDGSYHALPDNSLEVRFLNRHDFLCTIGSQSHSFPLKKNYSLSRLVLYLVLVPMSIRTSGFFKLLHAALIPAVHTPMTTLEPSNRQPFPSTTTP